MERNITQLFAEPILVMQISLDSELENFLENVPMKTVDVEEYTKRYYGLRSQDTYILHNPICAGLKTFILQESYKFMTEVLGYAVNEATLSQSWVSHKLPGQKHEMHTHANSIVSGVCYFSGDEEEQLLPITFHKKTNHYAVNTFEVPKQKGDLSKMPCSWDYYTFSPKKGTIILFPSYLPHSVPINESDKVRKSLAFNIVPKSFAGLEDHLTELKYEKVI